MNFKEVTLEDTIARYTENLAKDKTRSDINVAKLTERFERETNVVEKTRLQNLITFHINHRASLDLVDAVEEATKKWNELQTILNP